MLRHLILLTLFFSSLLLSYDDIRGLKQLQAMKEEQRIALVIGINDYKELSDLKNPVNDARAMQKALKTRGFEVLYLENASKTVFKKSVKRFSTRLSRGGVGLFYFAGHGIQVDGNNYLVANDSDISEKDEVEFETIALNYITKKMKGANNRFNIIILDACRNDPFSRSGGGGLAPVRNARGIFVAYATEAGAVAKDGSGSNGIFTKHLIEHMSRPVPIEKVFKRTRQAVYEESDHEQFPGVYNQSMGEFFFTLPKEPTITTQTIAVPKSVEKKSVKEPTSYTFNSIPPDTFSLIVRPTPSDAKVQITNIGPRYRDGIRLKKGTYSIKVSKAGYLSKRGEVRLHDDLSIAITLERKGPAQVSKASVLKSKKYKSHIEPEMILIKAGSFMMGSNDGKTREKPIHLITIGKDLYFGRYEVTFSEYDLFCKDTARKKPDDQGWGRAKRPVINISWDNAKAYTKWLSKKSGKKYRLPTEAQWEYAARAGTNTKYSWGESVGKANANCVGCGSKWDYKKSSPVGSFSPNPWGLHDMHGNVWEWCEDWYVDDYQNTPIDGEACDKGAKKSKVLRGGSWNFGADYARSANRGKGYPYYHFFDSGFRLVRESP